MAPKIV